MLRIEPQRTTGKKNINKFSNLFKDSLFRFAIIRFKIIFIEPQRHTITIITAITNANQGDLKIVSEMVKAALKIPAREPRIFTEVSD